MAQWDDDGATRGAAFIELRDKARQIERAFYAAVEQVRTMAYAAQGEDSARLDAERWRFLVSLMEYSKGGAYLTVNQHLAYYEKCEPGEEVSFQWYPDTPIGSYNIESSTITEAIDAARASAETGGVKS